MTCYHTYTVHLSQEQMEATDRVISDYLREFPLAEVDDAIDAIFVAGLSMKTAARQWWRNRPLFVEIGFNEEETHL